MRALPLGIIMFAAGMILAGTPLDVKQALGIGDFIFTAIGIILFASGSVLLWLGTRNKHHYVGNIHLEMDEVQRQIRKRNGPDD